MSMDAERLIAFGDKVKAYKSEDGKKGIVEAVGVRFGNHKELDFYGDYFTQETDFGSHKGNGMAATLNHRIPLYADNTTDEEATVLERVSKMKFANPVETYSSDVGIVAQHILDLSNEYEKMVFDMAEAGYLRWSSGTAAHMVDRDVDGEIKTWHIIEWAYTPQPAEPRLPRIAPVKTLENLKLKLITDEKSVDINVDEALEAKAVDPKDAGNASDTVAENVESATKVQEINSTKNGENIMSENENVQTTADILAAIEAVANQVKAVSDRVAEIDEAPVKSVPAAPAVIKTRGDDATKALAAYIRSGDMGGVSHLRSNDGQGIDLSKLEVKASNAVAMQVGTDAEGGYAVPTGHYQNIIARRDEELLYPKLGVMEVPGKGTTVNVPVDNEADGEFVATNEEAQFDLDSPALSEVAMTLAKYTKRILLSDELMEDEDSNLIAFVENWVGRGWARTHNSALMTAVLAGGTAGLTLDAAAAIGAAEVPELQYKLPDGYEDNAAWVMQKATLGYLRGLTGNDFLFSQMPYAERNGMQFYIDSYPVYTTGYAEAIGGGNKSLVFGNFNYVGVRVTPELKVIVDPFTRADYGQIRRVYSFRTVYKVLQAEAIQYATHPTA